MRAHSCCAIAHVNHVLLHGYSVLTSMVHVDSSARVVKATKQVAGAPNSMVVFRCINMVQRAVVESNNRSDQAAAARCSARSFRCSRPAMGVLARQLPLIRTALPSTVLLVASFCISPHWRSALLCTCNCCSCCHHTLPFLCLCFAAHPTATREPECAACQLKEQRRQQQQQQ